MRKFYPYLRDAYLMNLDADKAKENFLAKINSFVNRKLYTKITLLDWQENPLKAIEGEIVSGNQSKDGNSSVRNTCSMTCTFNGGEYSAEDLSLDYSLNKKVFLEIGIRNDTNQYPDYPILWFPQGVFLICGVNFTSSSSTGVNMSITLKDKMCMLNGDLSGYFGSTVVLDTMDTQLPNGEYTEEKVLVYNIIQELLNHYGNEDLNNIVIDDVPLRIKRVMKWTGYEPLYMLNADKNESNFSRTYTLTTPSDEDIKHASVFNKDDDIGYVYDDFFYTGELVAGPKETITSVLDKIKNYLGNYEYYYDVYGIFHFREIRNYVNTTLGKVALEEMSENDYLLEVNNDKTLFAFTDSDNITAITSTPQYTNIKNDYIVQGLREQTDSQLSYPIMYHLAIDSKPMMIKEDWQLIQRFEKEVADDAAEDEPEYEEKVLNLEYHYGSYEDIIIYTEPDTELQKAAAIYRVDKLPEVGNLNLVYYDGFDYRYWDGSVYQNIDLLADYTETKYLCRDWRTKLYMDGVIATRLGIDQGYYYPELSAYWPQIYDLVNQCFIGEREAGVQNAYRSLVDGVYYLDFIDPSSSSLGEYSVSNIGRRTTVTVDDNINCLFQPEIPNVVLLDITSDDFQVLKQECIDAGQPWTGVRGDVFNLLATGGYHNGAFDQIKYDLYLHTRYSKNISITALPAYWLEPNTRVRISEHTTNTYGDYLASSINYTFGPGSTMSVTCSEVAERF